MPGLGTVVEDMPPLAGEQTEFNLASSRRAFALPLNGFTTSYEVLYQAKAVGALPKNWLLGLPLLLEYPGGVCGYNNLCSNSA